ncbi:TPA: hypothetical protein DCW61_05265 [Candidatus Uhrbacteria bacterium]|nr:hypothetical protein [Candidatus Uhrbacteria bacterium]
MSMTHYLEESNYWRSNDLSLCAAILLGRPLEAIDKTDRRKAEFIFRRDDELDGFIERFWRGEVQVEPRRYFNALREIKARLYS